MPNSVNAAIMAARPSSGVATSRVDTGNASM